MSPPLTRSVSTPLTAIAVLALLLALLPLSPAAADDHCDISWTGAESADFFDADNWDAEPAAIPDVTDVVCIGVDVNLPVLHDDGDAQTEIAALHVDVDPADGAAFELAAGRLRLNEPSHFESARLRLTGGELDHNTTLRLGGGIEWLGGILRNARTGDGTTILESDSTIEGAASKRLTRHSVELANGAEWRNTGTVSMDNAVLIDGDGTFVNADGAEVNDLGAGANIVTLAVPVVNDGDWRPRARGFTFTGGMINNGSLRPTFGTTTTFGGNDVVYRFTAGSLTTSATSAFDNITYILDNNARFVIEPGADFSMQGDNLLRGGGIFPVLTVDEDIELGRFTFFSNVIEGEGSIAASGRVLLGGVTIEGAEGTELRAGGELGFYAGSGTRILRAGRHLVAEGDVTDRPEAASNSSGLFRIAVDGLMTVAGDYDHAGDRLEVLGRLEVGGVHRISSIARLGGTGTVAGDVENGGRVGPGTSPGTLTIDGDYDQTDDGTLEIELAGTDAGDFDVLAVTGDASLDGDLQVLLTDGFTPEVGDTFEILTGDSVTGTFATEDLPDLGEDAQMFVVYGPDVVLLVVTDGSEPDITFDPEPEPDPEPDPEPEPTPDPEPEADPEPEPEADPESEPETTVTVSIDDTTGETAESDVRTLREIERTGSTLPDTGGSTTGLILTALLLMLLGSAVLTRRPRTE